MLMDAAGASVTIRAGTGVIGAAADLRCSRLNFRQFTSQALTSDAEGVRILAYDPVVTELAVLALAHPIGLTDIFILTAVSIDDARRAILGAAPARATVQASAAFVEGDAALCQQGLATDAALAGDVIATDRRLITGRAHVPAAGGVHAAVKGVATVLRPIAGVAVGLAAEPERAGGVVIAAVERGVTEVCEGGATVLILAAS